ncbi:Uncharacterised protein [Bacteroides xylanisolvens]|nr:Uncharacterised protein [Bacteroides xylanisolvens]
MDGIRITDEDADLCLFRHLLQLCALGEDGVDQLFVIFVVKFHITVIDRDFHGNTSEIMDFRMESRGFKVQGSGFRVVVAASPQIKDGRCPNVVFKLQVTSYKLQVTSH